MVAMLALTVADVVGIKLLKTSMPGGMDLADLMGIVVTGFAIAFTKILRGHVSVEILVMRLPRRAQDGLSAFVSLLGLALFILLVWQSFVYGRLLQTAGEASMTYGISKYPFAYAMALAGIPVCLVLILDFIRSLSKAVAK